ncbi:hypothetical protein ES703_81567 [subsurface metagenome]
MKRMVELGDRVKDTITDFEGVAIGRAEYLHAYPSVQVEASTLQSGKPVVHWFPEARLRMLVPEPVPGRLGLAPSGSGQKE